MNTLKGQKNERKRKIRLARDRLKMSLFSNRSFSILSRHVCIACLLLSQAQWGKCTLLKWYILTLHAGKIKCFWIRGRHRREACGKLVQMYYTTMAGILLKLTAKFCNLLKISLKSSLTHPQDTVEHKGRCVEAWIKLQNFSRCENFQWMMP